MYIHPVNSFPRILPRNNIFHRHRHPATQTASWSPAVLWFRIFFFCNRKTALCPAHALDSLLFVRASHHSPSRPQRSHLVVSALLRPHGESGRPVRGLRVNVHVDRPVVSSAQQPRPVCNVRGLVVVVALATVRSRCYSGHCGARHHAHCRRSCHAHAAAATLVLLRGWPDNLGWLRCLCARLLLHNDRDGGRRWWRGHVCRVVRRLHHRRL